MDNVKISEITSESFQITKSNFVSLLVLWLVSGLLLMVAFVFGLGIGGLLLAPLIMPGLLMAVLKLVRDKQKPDVGEIFSKKDKYLPCLYMTLIFFGIVFALMIFGSGSTLISFIANILSGIAGVITFLGYLLIYDAGLSFSEARDKLINYTMGNFLFLLGFSLLISLFYFLGAMALLVGLLFAGPLASVMYVVLYEKIKPTFVNSLQQ